MMNLGLGLGLTYASGAGAPVVPVELITNGTFDSDTAWTNASGGTGTAVISGGVLTVTSATIPNIGERWQQITTVPLQIYTFSCNVGGTPAIAQLAIGTTSTSQNLRFQPGLSASYSTTFQATTTTTFIRLRTNNASGTVTFDNVSVL